MADRKHPRMLNRWLGHFLKALRTASMPARKSADQRHIIGQIGEREAYRMLKDKGFRILCRNWRKGNLELDIVARDGAALVFVEVRTRKAGSLVSGYHSINARKKRSLLKACRAYLNQMRGGVACLRFDVVDVQHDCRGHYTLKHFANIPLFPKNFHKPKPDG